MSSTATSSEPSRLAMARRRDRSRSIRLPRPVRLSCSASCSRSAASRRRRATRSALRSTIDAWLASVAMRRSSALVKVSTSPRRLPASSDPPGPLEPGSSETTASRTPTGSAGSSAGGRPGEPREQAGRLRVRGWPRGRRSGRRPARRPPGPPRPSCSVRASVGASGERSTSWMVSARRSSLSSRSSRTLSVPVWSSAPIGPREVVDELEAAVVLPQPSVRAVGDEGADADEGEEPADGAPGAEGGDADQARRSPPPRS